MKERSRAIFEKLSDLKEEFIIEADEKNIICNNNLFDNNYMIEDNNMIGKDIISINTQKKRGYLYLKIAVAIAIITTVIAITNELMKNYNKKMPATTTMPTEETIDIDDEDMSEFNSYREYLESKYSDEEIEEIIEKNEKEANNLDEWYDDVYNKKYGYITSFKNNSVSINEVEWITEDDEKRVSELGIGDQMPGGFYIYDEVDESIEYKIDKDVKFVALYDTYIRIVEDISKIKNFVGADGFCTYCVDEQNNLKYISIHYLP